MVSMRTIQEMALLIGREFRPDQVVLFGSYARGEATENSDVDLLVVLEGSSPPRLQGREIHRALSRAYAVPVDVITRTPQAVRSWREVPYSLIHEALKDGRVLYEKGTGRS